MGIINYTGIIPPSFVLYGYVTYRSSHLDQVLNGGQKYTLKFSGKKPLYSGYLNSYTNVTVVYNPQFHGTITNVSY